MNPEKTPIESAIAALESQRAWPACCGMAEAAAGAALCKTRLGHAALSEVNPILASLEGDPGEGSASDMKARWFCQRVLRARADARAAPELEQLFAAVQARATRPSAAADRDRLIQALPLFRDNVAAYGRRGELQASH